MNWRAVIFDLDDTLFSEREYVLSGFRAIANWSATNLNVDQTEAYAALKAMFDAGVRGDTFDRWLVSLGQSTDLVPKLLHVYREHLPTLSLFPGVGRLLSSLKSRYRLGLVTDGYLGVQKAKFSSLRLGPYFDATVFSDEWGRDAWKPSTRPFLEISRRLSVPADQAVYVADNPLKDFLGARSVGMLTVRTRHCAGDYARLEAPSPRHDADLTVSTIEELGTLLLANAC
jgi:putative hydrolase of the HAD superfamily